MTSEIKALPSWRLAAAILLCIVNAALAGVLLLQHHGEDVAVGAVSQLCGEGTPGAPSGCDTVARSAYSKIAGVPLAAYGFVLSLALALLIGLGATGEDSFRSAAAALALVALALALAVDLALLLVQAVAIKAFCRLCLATYAVNALALWCLVPARRSLGVLRGVASTPQGRVLLTSWVLGSLAVTAGVAGTEWGLRAREASRTASLLGLPAPSAAPAPTPNAPEVTAPEGSDLRKYQEAARSAAARAQELQTILDDPQKLEQYFTERANKEYEASPVYPLKLDGTPVKGSDKAPLKVVEFSDFLCPFCQRLAAALEGYLPQTAGRVALYFKNYPLDTECNPHLQQQVHPGACLLARGSICADEQGRFWQYYGRVFSQELRNPQRADVLKMAGEVGLDTGALDACLDATKTKDRLAAEIAEAKASGVGVTPTLFIQGKRLPRLQDFGNVIDKELTRRGQPTVPPPARR